MSDAREASFDKGVGPRSRQMTKTSSTITSFLTQVIDFYSDDEFCKIIVQLFNFCCQIHHSMMTMYEYGLQTMKKNYRKGHSLVPPTGMQVIKFVTCIN